MKQRLRTYGILALSVLLLYLVLRKVGLDELLATLKNTDPYWVLISLALEPLLLLASVIKWQILLKTQKMAVSLPRLYGLYMVGRFFNNFLPTTVGGDVVRGYELGNYTKDHARSMASVFVERLTGFIMLILLAIISIFSRLRSVGDIRLSLGLWTAVFGMVAAVWLILDPRPLDLIERWVKLPLLYKYIPKFRKFHAGLMAYRTEKQALALAMLWSFVFMVLAIANVYASALAFYKPISFLAIAAVTPVILVISMLPLTFNGLGIQEWAFVLLFPWIGLPASVGLSTIVLIRAKSLLVGVLGGLVYPVIKLSKGPSHYKAGDKVESGMPALPVKIEEKSAEAE
jgi:uncharacterized protein (TIRG00374 family)